MNRILEQLKAWYGTLEGPQRRQLWIALAIAVAGVAAVGFWSTTEPYRPLLSGRDYDQLLVAAAALDAEAIPYRLKDNGSIEVPIDRLGSAQAAVTAANIGPGIADVADLKLGLTPQAQDWAFLRAKEGDIASMINGIHNITASHVSIVPREDSMYFGEERPATASVFLRLRPGASLDQRQVRAIVSLVAQAVDGLSADRVTVADDQGNLLAEGQAATTLAGDSPSDMLEYRAGLEERYERAVRTALLPVLGNPRAFSVTASLELDLTSSETVTKRVDTEAQAVVSERMDESSSSRSEPGGLPGVDANLPERNEAATTEQQTSERSASTFNYAYPTVDEISHRPAGGVSRVAVAVQVDQASIATLATAAGDADGARIEREIRQAVEAAVGFDEARGDLVSVHFLPFAEREWVETTEVITPPPAIPVWVPYAAAALAVLLVFLFVVRPLMSAVTKQQVAVQKAAEEAEREAEAEHEDNLAERLRAMVDNFQPVDTGDLNRLVERDSSAAAQVIRMWNRAS